MAVADTARLIASLELDPRKFIGGADKALGKLGQMEGRLGRIGGLAAQGARNAGANVARIGAVAAGAISLAVKGGIASLADLEDATTSVQGAINQVGPTWRTNAQIVAQWANEIEASVDAAFDDKAITQASQTLIRYGKVSEDNLRPAMVVMTDLAARTGDVDSAATLLAKALADPTKAAGKLARQGIVLTKQQQAQIKAMVKAGDVAGAQTFLLGELEKSTKGAADAMAGPYRDALNNMSDASEDVQRLLGEGFLPVIQKVAKILREKTLDPAFMTQVKAFGQTLAGAFDKLLEVGGRIPWGQIGDSLKIAGAGAKVMFDAFTSLPPWVQTAVLTGWGLNKLSGGMLGGIVGELGKGLVKGVLGMNAGVVNINAARVNGGGPGGPTPVGGGGGLALLTAALAPGISAAIQSFLIAEVNKPGGARETLGVTGSLTPAIGFGGLPAMIANFGTYVEVFGKGVDAIRNPQAPGASVLEVRDRPREDADRETQRKLGVARDAIESQKIALVSAQRIGTAAITQTVRTGDAGVAAAIRAAKPVVNLSVNVSSTSRVSVYQTGGTINRAGIDAAFSKGSRIPE